MIEANQIDKLLEEAAEWSPLTSEDDAIIGRLIGAIRDLREKIEELEANARPE